jgi:hypothetical protein
MPDIDVKLIQGKGAELVNALAIEIHIVHSLLHREPEFVDNPMGPRLRDMDVNVDSAIEHLFDALRLLARMVDEGFVREEGKPSKLRR